MNFIIDRYVLPDGTHIQLESWHDKNTPEYPDLYGYTIGAYPKSKVNHRYTDRGETFRLGISMNKYSGYTDEDVKRDYELLKQGKITLEDLSDHYWYQYDDKIRMGLIDVSD